MTGKGTTGGFTLIELSIVLVIIGLIVGGILVGQDLIKAAEVRSQISQIEKYNSAVNTFRSKFNAIPGDMPLSVANQFGFTVGTGCDGSTAKRDGNGLIDGWSPSPLLQGEGEVALFWADISSAVAGNLIEGQFPNGGIAFPRCDTEPGTLTTTLGALFLGDYLPTGRIGHGTFIYVYDYSGYNWYGLSTVTSINSGSGLLASNATLPVMQAYSIDKKVDDGLPTLGNVQAVYINGSGVNPVNTSNAATDSTTTCYNTSSNVYSIGSAANYGNGGNCALSFRFQ